MLRGIFVVRRHLPKRFGMVSMSRNALMYPQSVTNETILNLLLFLTQLINMLHTHSSTDAAVAKIHSIRVARKTLSRYLGGTYLPAIRLQSGAREALKPCQESKMIAM